MEGKRKGFIYSERMIEWNPADLTACIMILLPDVSCRVSVSREESHTGTQSLPLWSPG